MQRLILGVVLVLAATSLSTVRAQQATGEVYQWKDARGVTHYSQTPPASGAYQQRVITHSGTPSTLASASAANAENPQCAIARRNITALESGQAAGPDADGDGKPDQTLDPAQRAAQLELAQAAVKAYCVP